MDIKEAKEIIEKLHDRDLIEQEELFDLQDATTVLFAELDSKDKQIEELKTDYERVRLVCVSNADIVEERDKQIEELKEEIMIFQKAAASKEWELNETIKRLEKKIELLTDKIVKAHLVDKREIICMSAETLEKLTKNK